MTHEEAREIYNAMITPCNETVYDSDTESDISLIADTVTAAVAAEREACAKLASAISDAAFAIYKGRAPESDTLKRGDVYADGYAEGAEAVATAIRARGAEGK